MSFDKRLFLLSVYLHCPGVRSASSLVAQFEDSVSRLPMREAVRYGKNNMKWTAADMKMYVDAHANALIEHRFYAGDKIALWVPESAEKVILITISSCFHCIVRHYFEYYITSDLIYNSDNVTSLQHVTLLAAAKIGLVVYDIDTAISTIADVRQFLTESKCKAIIFEPVSDTQDNLKLLRQSIPELFDCEL